MEFGVAEDAILLAESEVASVDAALQAARPTDLVLVFCDNITRSWKQIIYFRPKEAPQPVSPERLVAAAGFDVPEGYRLLSDERGVRIVPVG
jgi:cyanophycin synthetase